MGTDLETYALAKGLVYSLLTALFVLIFWLIGVMEE